MSTTGDTAITVSLISVIGGFLSTVILMRYGPLIRKRLTRRLPKEIESAAGIEKLQKVLYDTMERDDKIIERYQGRVEKGDKINDRLRSVIIDLQATNRKRLRRIQILEARKGKE